MNAVLQVWSLGVVAIALHEAAHVVVGKAYGFRLAKVGMKYGVLVYARIAREPASERGLFWVHSAPLFLHASFTPLVRSTSPPLHAFGMINLLLFITNFIFPQSDGWKAIHVFCKGNL